jgi:hypothetical protein
VEKKLNIERIDEVHESLAFIKGLLTLLQHSAIAKADSTGELLLGKILLTEDNCLEALFYEALRKLKKIESFCKDKVRK